MDKEKVRKSTIRCDTCEYYSKENDYCSERQMENCTEQPDVNILECEEYLIRENLIMFSGNTLRRNL